MWTTILLIFGIAIIMAMGAYSLYLFAQLRKQKQLFEQAKQARITRIKESIEIIARAMQSNECNHSEGVIRLRMLLEPLGQKRLQDYPAMWALYEVVQDMPTHDERKALKKNERMKLDLARESKEVELEEQIKEEVLQLLKEIA
ncbi:DUF2489 domain-containing protein [Actinobacillus porcinus]|uniref:DUF2489 domain-containing protein n=1 Tax=Actinobacillus porcinus TaxID=51048 RepID=UPI00235226B0|nr:DUF2489 domain-containing protein [Actinobacillus porcinus]MDD7544049.1 DUF2489 domain-containing protein [Actinobacillus porcinus]MDY5847975.1 DUF2489 domain-containing protein [Actinobacillus porcinus]MDY6217088.1 DUF2489 domain-containing protein [Actinobacillus porcinus]